MSFDVLTNLIEIRDAAKGYTRRRASIAVLSLNVAGNHARSVWVIFTRTETAVGIQTLINRRRKLGIENAGMDSAALKSAEMG